MVQAQIVVRKDRKEEEVGAGEEDHGSIEVAETDTYSGISIVIQHHYSRPHTDWEVTRVSGS